MTASGVSDCLPSSNLAEKEDSATYGKIFIDQITWDMYKYNYNN